MKKTNVGLLIGLFLFALFLNIAPAHAETITVPNDYSTIEAAIVAAHSGDTIYVKNGVYNESFTIDKSLTLIGEDPETTIIKGPTINIINTGVSYFRN